MPRIRVETDPTYEVVVGDDVLPECATIIDGYRKAVIVTQIGVAQNYREALGSDRWFISIGESETAKSMETVGMLGRAFADGGLLRDDLVVAFGGGVVGDTAGLAAALFHRGVALLQIPTTLVAQVDAAIGGKTAVNLPEGKNLIGAFHQPIAVMADTSTLSTLPDREFRSGLGEVVKYGLMPEGRNILDLISARIEAIRARDEVTLTEIVVACATIKAQVVAADPEERLGLRSNLNFGHTLAHALETGGGYSFTHGEAVGVGLVFAMALAVAMHRVDVTELENLRSILDGLGLPSQVEGKPDRDNLLAIMRRDKKSRGGLAFVLPSANGLELVEDPPPKALAAAFLAVGA